MRTPAPARFLVALLVSAALLAGCDGGTGEPDAPAGEDLTAVLVGHEDFTSLAGALQAAGLGEVLAGPGPFTVFAPTDDAFLYLGAPAHQALLAASNRPRLVRLLGHLVVPQRIAPDALVDGARFRTLAGDSLRVRREGDAVFVGDARVNVRRYRAVANGAFVPVDALVTETLDVAGHLALTPTVGTFARFAAEFGVLPALAGPEPVTVFAPINDAFKQLEADPQGRTGFDGEALLVGTPANRDVLARVVGLHVVPGVVRLADLASGTVLTTRDGVPVTVTKAGGAVFLDGRRVLAAPVETTNGLVYQVQTLLLDGLSLWDRIRITPTLETFREALRERPDLTARLAGTEPLTVVAPVSSAFTAVNLNSDVRVALNQPVNAPLFDRLIRAHVLVGRYDHSDLDAADRALTVNGLVLRVRSAGSLRTVEDRILLDRVDRARNGFLYRAGAVVLPPSDAFDTAILNGLTLHAAALRAAGLEGTFRAAGPLTMFAIENFVYLNNPGLAGRPDLARVLRFHGAAARLDLLEAGLVFRTLDGLDRRVLLDGRVLVLEGSGAIGRGAAALNGLVYPVAGFAAPP